MASLEVISHSVCPCVVLQSLSTDISNKLGFFFFILPKYSQKALADFPPDSSLFAHCLLEWGEGSRVFFLLIAVRTVRRSSTFVGYEGVENTERFIHLLKTLTL